jgi:hypothetical protein
MKPDRTYCVTDKYWEHLGENVATKLSGISDLSERCSFGDHRFGSVSPGGEGGLWSTERDEFVSAPKWDPRGLGLSCNVVGMEAPHCFLYITVSNIPRTTPDLQRICGHWAYRKDSYSGSDSLWTEEEVDRGRKSHYWDFFPSV